MKPFNLEEAKAGKPVCTRDGSPARIICFDRRCEQHPIVALYNAGSSTEPVGFHTKHGKSYTGQVGNDLFMLTTTTTVWVNIYKGDASSTTGVFTYPTKEAAEEKSATDYGNGWLGAFPITIEE